MIAIDISKLFIPKITAQGRRIQHNARTLIGLIDFTLPGLNFSQIARVPRNDITIPSFDAYECDLRRDGLPAQLLVHPLKLRAPRSEGLFDFYQSLIRCQLPIRLIFRGQIKKSIEVLLLAGKVKKIDRLLVAVYIIKIFIP